MQTFPRQALLQTLLPAALDIFKRHALATTQLETLAPLIAHFQIRVPLIGAFSSGKSSLINAFIGEPELLSTDITPETAVPTEVHYAPEQRFVGHLSDGSTCTLLEADVRAHHLDTLQPKGWLEIGLPNAALAARPHLVLVDMPGWASGAEAHERVIDNYASRSLAYVVVVSVEDGTLRQSLRGALHELAGNKNMPILVVITKTESRLPHDVDAVFKQVSAEVSKIIGREPFAVATTSARAKNVESFATCLDALEKEAETVFESAVVTAFLQELAHARQHLQLLANQDNKDAARIQADMDSIAQQMLVFDHRLQSETEALEAKIGPILDAVRLRVENSLAARLDSLTSRAMNGDDISNDILTTARSVIADAQRNEFEPAMQLYLARLEEALPSNLNFRLDLSRLQQVQTPAASSGGFQWTGLVTVLGSLLTKIPNPYAKAIGGVIQALGTLLMGNRPDQQQKEVEEARQRERARDQVRQALTEAAQQIQTQLEPVLHGQVQQAKAEIARHVALDRAELEKTLTTLRAALDQGEAVATALREKATADLQKITDLQTQIDNQPVSA